MTNTQKNLVLVVVFGLTLPLAVVVSTHLAGRTFERVRMRDQTVSVKGSAERLIHADRATWAFSLSARDPVLKSGYAKVEADRKLTFERLAALGLKTEAISAAPVQYKELHPTDKEGHETNAVEGYVVSQSFSVSSADVDLVEKASIEACTLIKDGVQLEAEQPKFLCANLADLKLELLAKATANARDRAKQLIGESGIRLGAVRSASQGVFQITRPDSVDSSAGGEYDTTGKDKVIRGIVTLEYAIE